MLDKEYEFVGQNEQEKVVDVIKYHPWFFVRPLLKILGLLLILLILFKFFGASAVTSYSLFIIIPWITYIILVNWFRWANTVYLITNHRIICVDQSGLFRRIVSEAILTNILFMSHKIEGFLPTFLNIGSVHLRTSGVTEEEIVLKNIKDPYEVQQEIAKAQKKYTGKEAETEEHKKFWRAQKKEKVIR